MPASKRRKEKRRAAGKKQKGPGGLEPHLRAKHQFYTYPRCPITKECFLDQIDERFDIEYYFVCEEFHKDPEDSGDDEKAEAVVNTHLHGYFAYFKREYCLYSKLHLEDDDGTVYKGNYQKCRSASAVVKYCGKDGSYLTNMEQEDVDRLFLEELRRKGWGDVAKAAIKGELKEAFELALAVGPKDVILRGPGLMKGNLAALSDKKAEKRNPDWKFRTPPLVASWDRSKYSLVLVGEGGLGKTEFACSLFENPLVITDFEALRKIGDKYDGLVFDDVNMAVRSPETSLHVAGVQDQPTVNVKYGSVELPRGLPRVFVHNYWPFQNPVPGQLKRRLHVVFVRKDLRVMNQEARNAASKPSDDLEELLVRLEGDDEVSAFLYDD